MRNDPQDFRCAFLRHTSGSWVLAVRDLGCAFLSCSPDPVETSSRACDDCAFVKFLTAHSKHRRKREVRNASVGERIVLVSAAGNSTALQRSLTKTANKFASSCHRHGLPGPMS